ncbi:hypothetical protein ACHAWO_000528 [Cyclotella atomus]|uniref:Choline transporter-like protein n=1 Tax=Cyclotella atomus TaxID=382360 RepID=A0ABD3NBZ4_9STRA
MTEVFKTGLGLAAVGILPSEYIKQGDPSRLANGLDYHGNLCGVTNYITPRGDDVINLPKAYPLPSGLFVCVESCPDANNMDEFICGYETQQEIDELSSLQAKVGSEYSTEKTRSGVCQELRALLSSVTVNIPSKQMEDLLLSDSTTSNATANENAPTVSNDTSIAVSSELKSVSRNEAFDIIMADVHLVRYVIFGFGCGTAMALGAAFLIVIQLPCILHLIVWGMVFSVDAGLVLAGYYTVGISTTWEASGRPGNEALALYYGSEKTNSISNFMREGGLESNVRNAFDDTLSSSSSALPIRIHNDLGRISASCLCPDDYQSLSSFASDNEEIVAPTPSPLENLESDMTLMCGTGCFVYKELTYSTNTKYAGLYMVFVWFWTSRFIIAVGQLVVALSVSGTKSAIGNKTFIKGLCLVSVYHLGTAAFGSLIIAVIKTIRAVLTYIQKKASKSKLRVAIVILAVLKCLLWCLEKCLKFVNKQAYIQTAMFSYSFCKASRMGFFLILRNAMRIGAAGIVSQAVLFINKVFTYYGDHLNSLITPTLLIAITSYAVSEMFDEVFSMAISTILQCCVADEEMHEPHERYAPKELTGTLESTQQRYKRRRSSSSTICAIDKSLVK